MLIDQQWVVADADETLKAYRDENDWVQSNAVPLMMVTSIGTDATNLSLTYGRRWKQIRRFCLLIGDYQSALLCDRKLCPDRPLPMNPSTVCAYLAYMCTDYGATITDYKTGKPLKDRIGNYVKGTGKWNDPGNVQTTQAALKKLHHLYMHLREAITYSPACEECIALTKNKGQIGTYVACEDCHNSFSRARTKATGNVMTDPGVLDYCALKQRELSETHTVEGNAQLTPADIRDIRGVLLSAGGGKVSVENLKVYTMILIGIRLFLRSDELLNLQFNHVVQKLTVINDQKGVQALAFVVKGKCDKKQVTLMVWANDAHPDICPVRHLLLYIALSGRTHGYLFPAPGSSSSDNTPYPYPEFLQTMKDLSYVHLGKNPDECKLGTHTLRKTGYLFAIWGLLKCNIIEVDSTRHEITDKVTMAMIMKSARHTSLKNAATYLQDAPALYEFAKRTNNLHRNETGPFHDIHVETHSCYYGMLLKYKKFQGPLPFISKWYLTNYLGLLLNTELTVVSALNVACESTRKDFCLSSKLAILKMIPREYHSGVSLLLEDYSLAIKEENHKRSSEGVSEEPSRKKAKVNELLKPQDLPGDITVTTMATTTFGTICTGAGAPSRKSDSEDLPIRKKKQWQVLNAKERVERLLEIGLTYHHGDLTNAASTFYYNWVVRVSNCTRVCYGGNVGAFVSANGLIREILSSNEKYNCLNGCECQKLK